MKRALIFLVSLVYSLSIFYFVFADNNLGNKLNNSNNENDNSNKTDDKIQ